MQALYAAKLNFLAVIRYKIKFPKLTIGEDNLILFHTFENLKALESTISQ